MTISVGKMAGNAIVPYSQATRRTKQVEFTLQQYSTDPAPSQTRVVGYAYADSDGNWRLVANGRYITTTTARSRVRIRKDTLGDTTFKNVSGFYQAISCEGENTGNPSWGLVFWNDNIIDIRHGTTGVSHNFSMDVELDSEPTWAAANMESVTDASIYIEPASATQAGIVGGGNQVPGDTSGTAIAAGYIGEVLSTSQATITNANYTSRGIDTYAQDLSLSITSGSWEIILRGVSGPSGAGISMIAAKILIDGSPISDKEGLDKAIITTPWVNPSNGNHATLVMYHEATGNETITVETAKLTGSTTIQKSYWQLTAKRIG
jgi:hypothetical protein